MLPREKILDDVLVMRTQDGDRAAAERLVERYQPPLRYFLIRLLGADGPIDDVLQDVWLAVFRQIGKLQTREAFSVWIYRIARNRAYDFLRRARKLDQIPDDLPASDGEAEQFTAEDAAAVHRSIDKLAAHHREVLLLHFLEEMTSEQIAAVVGCPAGTVRSRVHHAKLLLRREMETIDAKH